MQCLKRDIEALTEIYDRLRDGCEIRVKGQGHKFRIYSYHEEYGDDIVKVTYGEVETMNSAKIARMIINEVDYYFYKQGVSILPLFR